MNKREKRELCEMIARWEWMQGGSTSQAAGLNDIIRDLLTSFRIANDDADLMFERVWKMCALVCQQVNVEFIPTIGDGTLYSFYDKVDMHVDVFGYNATVDLLDELDSKAFYERFAPDADDDNS